MKSKEDRHREAVLRLHNHPDRDVFHADCSACRLELPAGITWDKDNHPIIGN